MRKRKSPELPASLSRLGQRFAAWRKKRTPGQHIPKSLWKSAVEVAAQHGVSRTAALFKLDYHALQKRVEDARGSSPSSTFVELPPVSLIGESVIEWEDVAGARMLERQQQQLEYEAQRAFEQYNAVDPRNRLSADELERRWNTKLQELEKVRVAVGELDEEVRAVTEAERDRVTRLGQDFGSVWNHPDCPPELKKKIARTIIEEIIAHAVDRETLRFVIHWKGGVHTEFRMRRPKSAFHQATSDEAMDIIRKMAVRYGDDQIASVLTRLGHRTGNGDVSLHVSGADPVLSRGCRCDDLARAIGHFLAGRDAARDVVWRSAL